MNKNLELNKLLELNNIFENINIISQKCKQKIRNVENGISLKNILEYTFKIVNIKSTQLSITQNINKENVESGAYKQKKNRTQFLKKERTLNIDFFDELFKRVFDICKDICGINNTELNFCSTDGSVTHSNIDRTKGELQNATNMGYFFGNNNIPLELSFNGAERNNEIENLKEFINDHKIQNIIFVCDRAYFCYKLMDFIIEHNNYFLIRLDHSAIIIDSKNNIQKIKNSPNSKIINKLLETCRVIKKENIIIKEVTIKGGKKRKVRQKNYLYLLTNLTQKDNNGIYIYSDEYLINQYKLRWTVETYFKLIKNCFKFDQQYATDEDTTIKRNKCIQIITTICKSICAIYQSKHPPSTTMTKKIKTTKNKKNKQRIKCTTVKTVECVEKVNESNLIENFYTKLLDPLLNGKLTHELLEIFLNFHVETHKNETGRYFERTCISPFKKWYIKKYALRYLWDKIISAIENGTVDKLNKNLKLMAGDILKVYKETTT